MRDYMVTRMHNEIEARRNLKSRLGTKKDDKRKLIQSIRISLGLFLFAIGLTFTISFICVSPMIHIDSSHSIALLLGLANFNLAVTLISALLFMRFIKSE